MWPSTGQKTPASPLKEESDLIQLWQNVHYGWSTVVYVQCASAPGQRDGFHLGCCLRFVHENVPSNQLSYCDLAEIYYLFFPIQVNAHTSASIYSFIPDFGPVSFGFLLFLSFLRRPLYWQLEPFGVFFLSSQKKSWITHSEAKADFTFCSDICKHVSVTENTSGLC